VDVLVSGGGILGSLVLLRGKAARGGPASPRAEPSSRGPGCRNRLERETFRYHWLKLRAVAHPTEDLPRVREAVRFVAGLPEDAFAPVLSDLPMETHTA